MAATSEVGAGECSAVFVCDLAPGLTEEDLRQVFGSYGDIVSIEQVNDLSEEAVFVEFSLPGSAEEAQSMLNYASMRDKTCRCMFTSSLDVIRQTMDTGQRLVVENLDPAILSRGLLDVCGLFGQILDCKVELDEEERSRGYGFAHFAQEAEASKARSFLDKSRIGESTIVVRPFEAKDAALFTSCAYGGSARGPGRETETTATPALLKDLDEASAGAGPTGFPELSVHHLEVISGVPGKLERVKALTKIYNVNQEQQMVIIANSSNLEAIGKMMGEMFEEGDCETVSFSTTKEARKDAIEGYEMGNLFVLILAADVAIRQDFEMTKKAMVLVNFDFPSTLQAYFQRLSIRADKCTSAHGFFTPEVDKQLSVPLMAAMEEAGQDIPPDLVECWTGIQKQDS